MHVGNFVCMCMDKFVGMKFFRLEILAMEKFCWVCDVGSWKIFVVMILAMWEFTCCARTCRKLFVGYLGHVEIFVHGYGKRFGSCVWICEKFWLWWNFWWSIVFFFFGCEQFLVMWVLVVEFFFWTCDFFCMEFLDMWVAAWEFFFFFFWHVICHGMMS